MTRFISAIKTDVRIQFRNRLYYIGIVFAIIVAVILAWLHPLDPGLAFSIPIVMILLVGGSTLLYVVGMITFEKEEGTLSALIVSPLTTGEYLQSKVVTLTALATLEGVIIVVGAFLWTGNFGSEWLSYKALSLLGGIVALGIIYTLVGIVVIVRYERLTDALVPVLAIAVPFQLPFLYFWVPHWMFLVVPSTAPMLMIAGAFRSLTTGEWVYAIGYTFVCIVGLTYWAHAAFRTHIITKAG